MSLLPDVNLNKLLDEQKASAKKTIEGYNPSDSLKLPNISKDVKLDDIVFNPKLVEKNLVGNVKSAVIDQTNNAGNNTNTTINETLNPSGRPTPKGYIQGYLFDFDDTVTSPTYWDIKNNQFAEGLISDSEKKLDYYGTNRIVENAVDNNIETFKYGIERTDEVNSLYEDPTYLGFDVILDIENSPLFKRVQGAKTSSNNSGVEKFLTDYSLITDMKNRLKIYYEFISKFTQIFGVNMTEGNNNNQNSSIISKNIKPHYLNTISGLNKLNDKIVNYKNDDNKLVLTLSEDISMNALYLSELYNNLVYSYKNQRYMIPENLLRFDMWIKIQDFRDFRINQDVVNENRNSFIFYKLHDCSLDFSNSMNIPDSITVGGFDAAIISTPASLSFNIFYKSISREMYPNLIYKSYKLKNRMTDIFNNNNMADSDLLFNVKKTNVELIDKKIKILRDNKPLNEKQNFFKGILNKTINSVENTVTKTGTNLVKKGLKIVREERGILLNGLINEFRTATSIPVIYPNNVYDEDFNRITVENAAKELASDLSRDLEKGIRDIGNFKI